MDYIFLQNYWWFVVSLLGGLLVFLLFVQGGNSLLLNLPKDETQRQMMINSTGRKWEFTFTTLVTFGGAFFASFQLWRCLLGMDVVIVYFRSSGCEL